MRPDLINSDCDLCKPNQENVENCPLPTSEHCKTGTWRYWNDETQAFEAEKDELLYKVRNFNVDCKGN